MKYLVDHDLHLHSTLSRCCHDPHQTPEALLAYAQKNHFHTIGLSNHFWDSALPGASDWYSSQDFTHLCTALPLPGEKGVRFLFGAEAEVDCNLRLGITRETLEKLDYLIIATTHLHHSGFTVPVMELSVEQRANLWCERLSAVLSMDLPFEKIGIAHLTTPLIFRGGDVGAVLEAIPDTVMEALFSRAAHCGAAIELNASAIQDDPCILRPYLLAKRAGCKFYLGSDAHNGLALEEAPKRFSQIVRLLNLCEEDKAPFTKKS